MKRRAFTFVEIITVVSLLLIVTGFSWSVYSNISTKKQRALAKQQMSSVAVLLEAYKKRFGDYPEPLRGHHKLQRQFFDFVPLVSALPVDAHGNFLDPWGTPYRYYHKRGEPRFILWSSGPDKCSYFVEEKYDGQKKENLDDILFSSMERT